MKKNQCPCEPKGCKGCHKYDTCCVVCENTLYCRNEKEFHHKITHIVPVEITNVETHYNHHEYKIEKTYKEEYKEFDCGKEDVTCCNYDEFEKCED